MKKVEFIRHHSPYAAGEIAAFADDRAAALCAAGVARDPNQPKRKAVDDPPEGKAVDRAPADKMVRGAADKGSAQPKEKAQ